MEEHFKKTRVTDKENFERGEDVVFVIVGV
jgi:hypothetical protein